MRKELRLASEREAIRKSLGANSDDDVEMKLTNAKDELMKHISPLGQLSDAIPPLLDAKRVKHGIPDEAFRIQAVFDICYISQLPAEGGENYFEGGLIVRPDSWKSAADETNPRGIIVSAGLRALDDLRSHGMDIGHTVYIQRLSPFRLQYAVIGGLKYHFLVISAGDITGSVDLWEQVEKGEASCVRNEEGQHVWEDKNGCKTTHRIDRERE